MPEVKKIVQETNEVVSKKMNDVDMKGIGNKVKQAIAGIKQQFSQMNNTGTSKTLETQFNKAGASVQRYQGELEQTKAKLAEVYSQMDSIQSKTWKQYTPEGIEVGNKAVEPVVNNSLNKNTNYQSLIQQEEKLNQQVVKLNLELSEAQQKYAGINLEVQRTSSSQNKFTGMFANFKKHLSNSAGIMSKFKGIFSQIPQITQKIAQHIKGFGTGFKSGLKNVLKYAMALFSLRSIYSTLSSSAQSWLSSQTVGAKQLTANIDYMKYAMGSSFAPIIQYVTGLMYNLMRAIQSVVFALFKVNIFAGASAKSYANMAGSAGKAKKETQSLAGIHDEINNVQSSDSEDGGASTGSMPNMDLSGMDSQLSPFAQKLVDFFKPLIDSWNMYGQPVIEQFKTTISSIGTLMSSVWGSFENIITNGTIYTTLQLILDIIGNIANAFSNAWNYNGNGDAIVQNLANAFNNLLGAINNVVKSPGFQDFLKFMVEKFREISEKIGSIDWQPIIDALAFIGETVGTVAINILNCLVDVFKWLVDNPDVSIIIASIATAFGVLAVAMGIYNIVQETLIALKGKETACLIANAIAWVAANWPLLLIVAAIGLVIGIIILCVKHWEEIKEVVINVCTAIGEFISMVWNGICECVSFVINKIKEVIGNTLNFIKALWETIWNIISEKVTFVWNVIVGVISAVINNIKETINNVLNTIKTIWENIWNGLSTTISNVFNGIWNVIRGTINFILGGIEKMANGVVSGINMVIKALNMLHFDMPDWLGGGTFGFNIQTLGNVSLPRLAKGNVAYEQTAAIFGEYSNARSNPEITAPQSIMYDTMKQAMRDSDVSKNIDRPIHLTVNVSNKKIGEILLEDLKDMRRQTGKGLEALVN